MIIEFHGSPPLQIFQEIWRRQIYIREYPVSWRAPRTVVDIGANVGFFSLYAAQRWKQAAIFAYEPAPENFAQLSKNVQANNLAQIHTSSRAVAASATSRTLYLKGESGWHSLWANDTQNTTVVETTTLEEILTETGHSTIDFLKIDGEGAEYEILADREELLKKYVRFIAMEYHESSRHHVDELKQIFANAQFTCNVIPEARLNTGMLTGCNYSLEPH